MDLNGWTGKTHQAKGWTAIKVVLGAFKWRCEYCRINFASFRKRRESFTFSRWRNLNPDLVAEKPAEAVTGEKPAEATKPARAKVKGAAAGG